VIKINPVQLSILFLLISCGKHHSSGAGIQKIPNAINIDIDKHIDGQYLAIFETVNQEVTGKITGAFTFSRDTFEDELIADVRLTNSGSELIHSQNIRLGTRCPTREDDLNLDGVIDAKEGEEVYGRILIPLDGDLSSQSSHDGEFPVSDLYGNYIYSRLTKFSTFIKDLKSEDESEGYVKLKRSEPLYIEGMVVIIHGADEAVELQLTARGAQRLGAHQALPIACGVINKIIVPPGDIDEATYSNEF